MRNKSDYSDYPQPGLDAFKLELDQPLVLRRVTPSSPFAKGEVTTLVNHWINFESGAGDAGWRPGFEPNLDASQEWHHDPTGICVYVRGGHEIISVRANVSKLVYNLPHNGGIANRPGDWRKAMDRVWETLLPLTNRDTPPDCHLTKVEIGGVVRQPFADFYSLLRDVNYPGLHSTPMTKSGEYLRYGTGKGSKFSLLFYDKGRELWKKHKLDLPNGVWTRIEIVLKDDKLRKAFGGHLPRDLTPEKAHQVFWESVMRLAPDSGTLSDLPGSKAGILAMAMILWSPESGHEEPGDWCLRQSGHRRQAKTLVKEARGLAAAFKGRGLRDMLPPGVRFESLGTEPKPPAV